MKNKLRSLLGLGLVLVAASAFAQTIRVKSDVPFNFVVDKQTLTAGEYTIQSVGSSGTTLAIRDVEGKQVGQFETNRCEKLDASKSTKLVFHRLGDQYFLSQVWVIGQNDGHELAKTRQEKEVALNTAEENVVITASLR
jgi:hypothetical protein